jgi:hypothetical protein
MDLVDSLGDRDDLLGLEQAAHDRITIAAIIRNDVRRSAMAEAATLLRGSTERQITHGTSIS